MSSLVSLYASHAATAVMRAMSTRTDAIVAGKTSIHRPAVV